MVITCNNHYPTCRHIDKFGSVKATLSVCETRQGLILIRIGGLPLCSMIVCRTARVKICVMTTMTFRWAPRTEQARCKEAEYDKQFFMQTISKLILSRLCQSSTVFLLFFAFSPFTSCAFSLCCSKHHTVSIPSRPLYAFVGGRSLANIKTPAKHLLRESAQCAPNELLARPFSNEIYVCPHSSHAARRVYFY